MPTIRATTPGQMAEQHSTAFVSAPGVRLGETIQEAPAGSFVFIPRDVPHTWQNSGDTSGRLLALFTPASHGMEEFFQRFAATTTASVADAFAKLAPGAGMRVLGPPLAASHPL